MNDAFTNEDFQRLDEWLLRRRTGLLDAVMLEGFLTAIVIGPNTLLPMKWLPRVWGAKPGAHNLVPPPGVSLAQPSKGARRKQPHFRDLEEMNQFVALVMGLHNDIALHFDTDPGGFVPTFYESRVGRKRVMVVDEWCEGFMKGMRLDAAGWKQLGHERAELLRPLQLFGTRAGWRELSAGDEARMHATWSVRVAPAVREIYAYWLPQRRAQIAPEDAKARLR